MFARIGSFFYALIRGYLDEKRVRGDRRRARAWAEAAVAGTRALDTLQIQYWAGLQDRSDGKTFAVIDGGGAASVRRTTRSEVESFQGSISDPEFKALLRTMLDARWFDCRPLARPGPPGATMVRISLLDSDDVLKFTIQEWNGALGDDPALAKTAAAVRAEIGRISGGRISH